MASMSSHTCEVEDEPRYEGYYGRCGDDATYYAFGMWLCEWHYHIILEREKQAADVANQTEADKELFACMGEI